VHKELQPPPAIDKTSGAESEADVFVMPCSAAQKRFWVLEQILPGNPALQIPIALHLSGPLEADLLERALDAIVARHEILRTHFELIEDEPRQIIAPEAKLKLRRIEAGAVPPAELPEAMRQQMLAEVRQPLDFFPAPLLRATLVRFGAEDHLLMLTAHHIVSDGWSNGILVRELALFYHAFRRAEPASPPPLAIQYADYAVWQESWLRTPDFQKQLDFWNELLAGDPPVLDFPTDFARQTKAAQAPGAVLETLLLPAALTGELRQFCRTEGVTLFMVFHAAYVVLLRRYTGQRDFLVGTTAANRNKPELEALVGLFANILMLRSKIPPAASFRDFLAAERELVLGAFANHEAPFERVLELCQKETGGRAKIALQTHILYQKAFMQPATGGDLTLQPLRSVSPGSSFELTFGIVERAEGIRLQMEYRTSLFEGATLRRLLQHFQALLASAVSQPETDVDNLPLFAEGEREELEFRLSAAPAGDPRPPFDPAAISAQLDRELELHFQVPAAPPFLPCPELPPGVFLIALDERGRLLPLGIPGDLHLGHRQAELTAPAAEIVSGPSDSSSPVPLVKTGFIGRNREGGAVSIWGRTEDALIHQGFRLHRLARRETPRPAARRSDPERVSMQSLLHEQLLEIWREILHVPDLTIDDNFFDCGGTSFLALRMMLQVGQLCGRPLPLSLLLTGATIAHLTRFIIAAEKEGEAETPLIPLRTAGTRGPLFFLHGDWAGGGFYCRKLAEALGPDQPFYALPPYHRYEQRILTMEEMAAHHAAAIRERFPHGPYLLGGYCIGATVAMEVGRQLAGTGETVAQLFLVDLPTGGGSTTRWCWPWIDRLGDLRGWTVEEKIDFLDRYAVAARRWIRSPWKAKWAAFRRRSPLAREEDAAEANPIGPEPDSSEEELLRGLDYSLYFLAHRLHRFEPLSLPATFYFPSATPPAFLARLAAVSRMDPAKYRVEMVPGDHTTCVTKHTADLGENMRQTLDSLAGTIPG
jgi:hypothetical protein